MTILEHPLWPHVRGYFYVPERGERDNVDLLDLPDDLREFALEVVVNCCSCGAVIAPFRVRAKSLRARVSGAPDERRLFYAGTCASGVNSGCARTNAASENKAALLRILGKMAKVPSLPVEVPSVPSNSGVVEVPKHVVDVVATSVSPLPTEASAPAILVKRVEPRPSAVFDTYWRFAAERQAVYFRRLRGEPPPWTADPILLVHRFTNCYRAADRVSQYLIQNVIYAGDPTPREVVFRTILFKIFNRIGTWEKLLAWFGRPPCVKDAGIAEVLDVAKAEGSIYSAAYVMPSPGNAASKHRAHLALLANLDYEKILGTRSLEALYRVLLDIPSFGPFLAFQFAIDLNYSAIFDFDEDSFVVAGPGALDGLSKCFADPGEYTSADLICWTVDRQEVEFERLRLSFETLFGRRLHLIDVQNLYCEVSKYARVAHPGVAGVSGRTKIKQKYQQDTRPLGAPFFPPKWGLVP